MLKVVSSNSEHMSVAEKMKILSLEDRWYGVLVLMD